MGSGVRRAIFVDHVANAILPEETQFGAPNVERLRDSNLCIAWPILNGLWQLHAQVNCFGTVRIWRCKSNGKRTQTNL